MYQCGLLSQRAFLNFMFLCRGEGIVMPIVVNSDAVHPFLLSKCSPPTPELKRAQSRGFRPLEIALINIMADKVGTEFQLSTWLGRDSAQVNLTLVATDKYIDRVRRGEHVPTHTPLEHILNFYSSWSEIKNRTFDGVIVTGVKALGQRVEDESVWPEIREILSWTGTNAFSSIFLCWGAKAALKFFYDINSYKAQKKLTGIFEHRIVLDRTGLLSGLPDVFDAPVSRWKNPLKQDILNDKRVEIAVESEEAGAGVIVEPAGMIYGLYPKRVFVLSHFEYLTEILKGDYFSDVAKDKSASLPRNYFPDDDINKPPVNTWRHTGQIYTNWVSCIHRATPSDISAIPVPYSG